MCNLEGSDFDHDKLVSIVSELVMFGIIDQKTAIDLMLGRIKSISIGFRENALAKNVFDSIINKYR